MGKNIRQYLEGDLLAAVRRGILERKQGEYHLHCRTIDQYRRDFLKEMFLQSLGKGWQTRDEAIRNAARHLGFARTGSKINAVFRSIIRGLLKAGVLVKDGNRIRVR